MIKIANDYLNEKNIYNGLFVIFVFYFSAVSYFPQQVVREAKIELAQPL